MWQLMSCKKRHCVTDLRPMLHAYCYSAEIFIVRKLESLGYRVVLFV